MAERIRRTYDRNVYRKQWNTDKEMQSYVYGNAVPAPEFISERKPERKTNRNLRRDRRSKNAVRANLVYNLFLTVAVMFVVISCAGYLTLHSDVLQRSENIASMQTELANLTEANDAAFQAAEDSMNLEEVRARAIYDLGMVHTSQGRVVEYQKIDDQSVVQYESIPENGILAKSDN